MEKLDLEKFGIFCGKQHPNLPEQTLPVGAFDSFLIIPNDQ